MGRRPSGATGGAGSRAGAHPRRMRRRHRAGASVRDHPPARVVGEHHQRGGAPTGARTRSGRAGATPARRTPTTRAPGLFDRYKLPAFHDPFAGGGALPLEAQRLGLEAYASDLNPVAVLINKAMIEIPPKFAGRPPVNPESRKYREVGRGREERMHYRELIVWQSDEALGGIAWRRNCRRKKPTGAPSLPPIVSVFQRTSRG